MTQALVMWGGVDGGREVVGGFSVDFLGCIGVVSGLMWGGVVWGGEGSGLVLR